MKKSLLIAASLATLAGGSVLNSAKASTPNFTVTAATPGAITFSGKGTAQFNNSTGTNNSFQVGSSTNLGVNASSSSTAEYGVTGQASLDLAGTTTLKQVIGTSGSTSQSTKSRAHDVARTAMSSWSGGAEWDKNTSGDYASQTAWKAAYDAEYSRNYKNEYSTLSGAETEDKGTISGVFKTNESGGARAVSSVSDYTSEASVAAQREYGVSYEKKGGNQGVDYDNSAAWQAAYDREYNRAYGAASSGATRNSESEVTVNGIGSDANVQAADTSTFSVDIAQNTGQTFGSTATAQGSAGASLATSSFANQSQSSTASGFMQAFGGQ